MAASDEVDVVLNKATLTAKAAKPNQPKPNGKKERNSHTRKYTG